MDTQDAHPTAPRPPDGEADPAALRWAVRLLYAQATALAAVTAFLVYATLTARDADLRIAAGLTLFAALATGCLAAVARALARRRRGARGPAVAFQMMLLATGSYLLQGGRPWAGVLLIVFAVATGALVISPGTTRALGLG